MLFKGISYSSPPIFINVFKVSYYFYLLGRFTIQNIVPQPDGESSKVKVKVCVNVHGIFSVYGASLIEKQKGEAEDVLMEMEPTDQNEDWQEEQVAKTKHSFFTSEAKISELTWV